MNIFKKIWKWICDDENSFSLMVIMVLILFVVWCVSFVMTGLWEKLLK